MLLSVCDKERVDLFGEASSLGGIRLSLLDDLKIVVEDCHERIPQWCFDSSGHMAHWVSSRVQMWN